MDTEERVSCDQTRNLLIEFVENALNPILKQQVEHHLSYCEDCNASLQHCWAMQSLSSQWQDEPVPHWSRRSTFFETQKWWPGLQVASSFASVLVLIMVLFNIQISNDDGFSIGLANKDYLTKSEMEQKIFLLEKELQAQQQEQLQRRVASLSESQVETNQLLLRTILKRSREERREDLDTILTTWDINQDQQAEQTQQILRALFASQVEDRRNINQLNKLLHQASQEGNTL